MEIGSIIGQKYVLTRPIGRGGMGTVFEASHVTTGEKVAVKVMFASKSGEDEVLKIARFEREAIAIGKLDTPHVVRVYDAGLDAPTQQPFIAMEILHGEDVSHLLKQNGPLRVEAALAIVAQACVGLYEAHEAGIVHRDIKPGNLFVSRSEAPGEHVVKLLDFGIAKVRKLDDAISSELGTITETGMLVGSPYYMSPEQAKGLKTVDHRADVWSLGVVLYRLLTGRTPFDGHSTLGQVIIAVCSEDAPSVQLIAPWVPNEVAEIIRRALQRNVAQRFQNAYEMYEAIRPLLVNGGRITDDLLMPLPPEQRAQVQAAPSSSSQIAVDVNAGGLSHTPPPASTSFAGSFAASNPTMPAAPRKSRGLVIALALFAVLAIGTFAAGLFVKLAARSQPIAAAAPLATSATAPPPITSTPAAIEPASAAPVTTVSAPASVASTKAHAKPAVTGKATARPGAGRLQGGVGSDVPF